MAEQDPRLRLPTLARLQLRAATIYLLAGLVMGMGMASSGNVMLKGVHAHMQLLGWVTLAVTGLVYAAMPGLAASRLARWHVLLHNLGLPIMLAALAAYISGVSAAEAGIALGAVLSTVGLLAFTIVVWRAS